ncbi:MAG: CotH kinase family protein [Chitinispirillaceae bacterium]|nr:CotH kinase family protein [Chitinispirillaceae bacterium]
MFKTNLLTFMINGFAYAILVLAAKIEAVTLTGVVRAMGDGNRPVTGALVALDHTLFRTFTDSSGTFSLDIPEIGIGQQSQHKISKTLSIIYNQRLSSVFLSRNENVSEFAMYSLDGKEIVKKLIAENETKITVPHLSSGLYILRLSFSNGARCSGTLLSTPSMLVRKTSFNVSSSQKKVSAAVPSGHKIIFRHDNFYPIDKEYAMGMDTLRIDMKPDPRAAFFDDSKVHTMHFTMTNQDSLLMERNALAEEYAPAEINYNNTPLGKVGLRYKGSDDYSMPRCFDEQGNRSDYADCRNVSLKVKFDKYNKDTRFFAMKKLNLHAMSYDDSKMKEMFAYKMFRDMGIYTCRTVFVKVYVNNVFRGLFTAVESLDGRFTKSRWPDYGDGNLYKEVWPWRTGNLYYKNALETNNNEGDSIWPIRMIEMTKAIKASTAQNFNAKVSPFMDLNYFVNYIVVDRSIHNSDGIMTWYWEKNWRGNHNYYFYEEENSGGKAWLIPWDLNTTFHPVDFIIDEYDVPEWNVVPDSCQPCLAWGGDMVYPANCDMLTGLTAATCWDQFKSAGKYYLETIFTKQRMKAYLKKLTDLIGPEMDNDPWITKAHWEKQIRYFDASLDKLYSGFDDYLNGRGPSVDSSSFFTGIDPDSGFSTAHCNNFEFSKSFSQPDWIYTEASVNSTISASVDTMTPLWGKGCLKVQLVFNPADTSKTYAEWSYTGLSFKQLRDFNDVDSIRVCIQADVPRDCRISLQSDLYSKLGVKEGCYGWELTVNRKKQQISYAIENAEFPDWADTTDPGILDTVLTAISGIEISVSPQFESNGKLRFVPDSGLVKIDNVEFIVKKP